MKGKDPPSAEVGAHPDLSSEATVAKGSPRTGSSSEGSPTSSLSSLDPYEPLQQESPFPEWVPPEMLRVEHGRYELEVEHARGGLGRVWIARDLRFGRRVAIKELLMPTRRAVARFVREATVTAQLQHPSIIPVYDAGRWATGELFYAMKLISGRSLREMVEEAKTLDERLGLLPHILAVADAMAYAHIHRIIHRDIKPSNIMIGAFGETMVIDWGLAKDLSGPAQPGEQPWEDESEEEVAVSGEAGLTIAGAVLGTPQYMPPEQACGEAVDERADVYAIGALLFTLMVGKAPYAGTTAEEILTKVKQAEPSLFKALPPGVPRDLEAILRKAMAPRPWNRYPTAQALADDLRRFLQGQLVNAHEYSRLTLLWRWLARHRAVALFAALLAGVSAYSVRRIVQERQVALDRSNALVLVQARTALDRDPTQTLAWLKTLPVGAVDEGTVRNLTLDALDRGVARHVFRKGEGRLTFSAASPDGRWLAIADGHSPLLWDMKDSRVTATLPLQQEIARMTFSPDGRLLALTGWESTPLRLWDRTTGVTRELPGGPGVMNHVLFSSDGRRLAASRSGSEVELFELPSGERRVFGDHTHHGWLDVRLSPDGRVLAYAGPEGKIHLVEVENDTRRVLHGAEEIQTLEFSPDGRTLAAGATHGTLRLWDLERQSSRLLHQYTHGVSCLQFSGDGHHLLSSSGDGTVQLWNVDTGTGRILGEHTGGATWAALSSDGQIVASAGNDSLVRLWFLTSGDLRILRGHTGPVVRVHFLGDGQHLMSVSLDRTTRIWQLPTAPAQILHARNWIGEVAFSPDGHYLAAGDYDGLVWRWDRGTGEAVAWPGHRSSVLGMAFSRNSQVVASASDDGTVRLWEVASGKSRVLTGHTSGVRKVVFTPDGQRLASAGRDGALWLWEVGTGQGRMLPGHQGETRSLSFSPNGQWLASTGGDGLVLLTEVSTGRSRPLRGHGQSVRYVSFSHSGRWLASGGTDGIVQLWDIKTGQARLLNQQRRGIRDVIFSPDDRWVAAAGEDKAVLLCELASSTCRPLAGHTERISKLDFSPDGRLLASAGQDRTVRLWDVKNGLIAGLHHHDEAVDQVVFSPDGHRLASAGEDWTARLFSIPAVPEAPLEMWEFRRWLGQLSSATITSTSELATTY